VGALFMPWTLANAAALAAGQDQFTVRLADHDWTQKPQKYHARSLQALRHRYSAARRPDLDAVLRAAVCLDALAT